MESQRRAGEPQLQWKKSLPRSISLTNIDSTSHCRSIVKQDWVLPAPPGGTNFFAYLPAFTLTLPNLDNYPADFQKFVFERLIDKYTQGNLQNDKCLNWCRSATQLVPLFTTGDGNCLLHAASLAMWGFQDRDFTLRRAVYTALRNHSGTQLRRRWKYSREKENNQIGIQLKDAQWEREWSTVVSLASLETTEGMPLESLDDFHIFVLANVLRRPILIYAAPKLRSQAAGGTLQYINFHGIYLPLLWQPNSCTKDPLPLGYFGGHFVALVAIEYRIKLSKGKFTLPLTDFHGQVLPVRFSLRMEEPVPLIMDYLSTSRIPCTGEPCITTKSILGAQLSIADRPAYLQPLLTGFIEACRQAHFGNSPHQQRSQHPPVNSWESQPRDHQAVASTSSTTGSQAREKCKATQVASTNKGRNASQNELNAPPPQPSNGGGHSLNSGSIKCPKCANPGHLTYLGMCEACYMGRSLGDDIYNTVPDPPTCLRKATQAASANEGGNVSRNELNAPPPQPSNSGGHSLDLGSTKCPKCANPGHPSYLGMCEACYMGHSLGDDIYNTVLDPPTCLQKVTQAASANDSEQIEVQYGNQHKSVHNGEDVLFNPDSKEELIERIYELEQLTSQFDNMLKFSETRSESQSIELAAMKKLTERLEASEADMASRLARAEARSQELEARLSQELQPFWVVARAEIRMTIEEVGRGGWGAIKVADFRGQRVAAKMLHNEIISPNNIRLFSREMTMFSRVHHPNIVQFLGATREGTPIILLELMSTSLRSELGKSQLPRNLVLSIMSGIARALNYLHLFQPRPIIHRDVSSANVLLDPAVPPIIWKAKLSDFGSTNFVSNQATAGPGSPLYAAPEAFNPYQQTPKMDVFSYGAVLIEACTREMPSVEDREELIGRIAWVQVVPLIRRCMQVNQDDRPSMEGVLTELAQLQRTV